MLGFYGLPYWYTWQVSILGLGPIWMSANEAARQRTAALLDDGGIFGFGLSEKEHGADIYSTDMVLIPAGEGRWLARGDKYYIGNGNEAALLSIFGKLAGTGEYVFFVVDPKRPGYELVKNVVASQSYVAEFVLKDYPVTEADILQRGQAAWDAALNTVNVGKYNLGWASIGICTHALYEAIRHAANRRLYKHAVTDFPHVKRMFADAYARLVAMKLFALRASDYFRSASRQDRRYLLYNPMVKMKVTTEGEQVINLLWDVIAAKGFEKNMYFEMAARDIRGPAEARGHGPRQHRADREVHAELLLRPGPLPGSAARATTRPTTPSSSTRDRPAACGKSASTTPGRSSPPGRCPTCASSASRSKPSASCSPAPPPPRRRRRTSTSCSPSASSSPWSSTPS